MSDSSDLVRIGIQIYTEIVSYAIPIAFAFGIGNVIVNTFLSVGFGGRLKIGGK